MKKISIYDIMPIPVLLIPYILVELIVLSVFPEVFMVITICLIALYIVSIIIIYKM